MVMWSSLCFISHPPLLHVLHVFTYTTDDQNQTTISRYFTCNNIGLAHGRSVAQIASIQAIEWHALSAQTAYY